MTCVLEKPMCSVCACLLNSVDVWRPRHTLVQKESAFCSGQDPQPSRNVFNVFLRAPDGRNMDPWVLHLVCCRRCHPSSGLT